MCGKPTIDPRGLPPELQDKVFIPGPDIQDVEIDLVEPKSFGEEEELVT